MKISTYRSIALLGTSADPPTNGHQALLIGLCKLFPKVLTWASNNPGKKHNQSLDQRLELLDALVKKISLPNLELKQSLSHKWAVKTLEKASNYWPTKNLVLVIGSDLVKDIPTWFEAKDIFKKSQIGIVPRKGWPLKSSELQTIKDMGGKSLLLPLTIPNTASSDIKTQHIFSQVPEAILSIIKQKKLYEISENTQ